MLSLIHICFEIDHFRVLVEAVFQKRQIAHVDVSKRGAVACENIVADTESAAVDIVGQEHFVAGIQHRKHRHICRLTACESKAFHAFLQNRHCPFEFQSCRIGKTGVIKTCRIKQRSVTECGSLVDWHADRTGKRVMSKRAVNCLGFKM